MTAQEFGEWLAEYELYPWGDFAEDLRAGLIASTLANVNKGKDRAPYSPIDFMPLQKKTPKPEQIVEEDPTTFLERLNNNGTN
jgi:hypothetical protein